jgi:hypothetical protein
MRADMHKTFPPMLELLAALYEQARHPWVALLQPFRSADFCSHTRAPRTCRCSVLFCGALLTTSSKSTFWSGGQLLCVVCRASDVCCLSHTVPCLRSAALLHALLHLFQALPPAQVRLLHGGYAGCALQRRLSDWAACVQPCSQPTCGLGFMPETAATRRPEIFCAVSSCERQRMTTWVDVATRLLASSGHGQVLHLLRWRRLRHRPWPSARAIPRRFRCTGEGP